MNKKFMVVALMAALSTVGYAEVSLEQKVEENRVIATQAQNNAAHALIQNSKQDKDIAALEQNKVSKEEFDKKTEENRVIATQAQNNAAHALIQNNKQDKDIAALEQNKANKEDVENALAGKVDKDTFNKNNAIISEEIGKVDQKAEEAHNRIDKVVEVNKNQTADINKNKEDIKDLGTKLDNEVIRQDYKNKVQDQRLDKVEETNKKQDAEIAKKADKDYVDAENKKQDAEIEKFQGQMDRYDGRLSGLEKKVDHLDDKMNKGLSLMAAMNAVDFQNVQTGEMALGAGIGHYGNAQSVALGVAYSPVEDLTVNAKYSITAGDPDSFAVGAGATYEFKVGR